MSPEDVLQRYRAFDYAIRYLAPGVAPSDRKEPDTVFALEVGPEELARDARGRPLLFPTEAAAFQWRQLGGDSGPVLAFGLAGEDTDEEHVFDAGELTSYAEPWSEA